MSSSTLAKKQFLAPEGSACHLLSKTIFRFPRGFPLSFHEQYFSPALLKIISHLLCSDTGTSKLSILQLNILQHPTSQVSSASEGRRIAVGPNGNS